MSEYQDFYGSNARRAAQAIKDAAEIARPVGSPYRRGGFMALRPIAERVASRASEGAAQSAGKGTHKHQAPLRRQHRARVRRRGY